MTHTYLSTGCFHGDHEYCRANYGIDTEGNEFSRNPGVCKFCQAPCVCECHLPAAEPVPSVHY